MNIGVSAVSIGFFAGILTAASLSGCATPQKAESALPTYRTSGLPYVAEFDAGRYLGKWYEVARLSTPIQPDDTLATAEYTPANEMGNVIVKNTSYNAQGELITSIEGQAQIATDWSPGSLLVSFGPVLPTTPNYQVIYLDRDYQFAVVGTPNRQAMWILSREVPIDEGKLQELRHAALDAGFDLSKLVVAPWANIKQLP